MLAHILLRSNISFVVLKRQQSAELRVRAKEGFIERRTTAALRSFRSPTSSLILAPALEESLFNGTAGNAGDKAIEKEVIRNRYRDGSNQRAGHDLAPEKHIAADQVGRHPKRDRLLRR